jgi:MFS family permease
LWAPVFALAALYGALTISWVIYRIHLPGLLTKFGFSEGFAPQLLLIETVLAIALEPLAGYWSDRLQARKGNRFSLISVGVVLTAILFVATPLWVMIVTPDQVTRWTLPLLLILWAIAMALFRSPAVALLVAYASPPRLPLAASALTLMAGLAGAAMPLAKSGIVNLGFLTSFVLAAILLLATVMVLRSLNPANTPTMPQESVTQSRPLTNPVMILITGLIVTLGFRSLIDILPKLVKAQLPSVQPPLLLGFIFLAIAILSLPLGKLALSLGDRQAVFRGAMGMVIGLGLMLVTHNTGLAIANALLFAAAFSLASNGAFALSLRSLSPDRAGLGIGLFFGGAAIASSLMGLLAQLNVLSVNVSMGVGMIALLLGSLLITRQSTAQHQL